MWVQEEIIEEGISDQKPERLSDFHKAILLESFCIA